MKNEKIKPPLSHKSKRFDKLDFSTKKISTFQAMITNTILAIQQYKTKDIIGASELNVCIQGLESLYTELNILKVMVEANEKHIDFDEILTRLQKINNELSSIFRNFGTHNIEDLIAVAFASDFIKKTITEENKDKYELIQKYVHPISYKAMAWKDNDGENKKTLAKNRIVEDFMIVESAQNFECFDLARTSRKFNTKVYGIKVAIKNQAERKTLIISGLVDDIIVNCSNHAFIKTKIQSLHDEKPNDPEFLTSDFERFVNTLTIKELLIYGNDELYQRFIGYLTQVNLIKQKPISQNVKEFISCELYGQRRTLIQLLMKNSEPEFQYLAYLLYDLLTNDGNGNGPDTIEQTVLFDSLPWNIKKFFRDAMKTTLKYTKDLSNFDSSKIPIEQQICLLKATDNVKEKAMVKLKEVKAKSEDSGSKARQYLDGLLKIPFGIYKNEPMLSIMKNIKTDFNNITSLIEKNNSSYLSSKKEYTCIEIYKHIKSIQSSYIPQLQKKQLRKLKELFCKGKRDTIVANICYINGIIKKYDLKYTKLCHSGKKNNYMRDNIKQFLQQTQNNKLIFGEMQKRFPAEFQLGMEKHLNSYINTINVKWDNINNNMTRINTTLNNAIHGHSTAKRQLKRIIGQWINGKQTGYCFGFEGPPGVGKTSLAKNGLSQCLLNETDNTHRPFAFIPVGGSCNGSTLSGHNYTYVGSTWGRIVDILIDKKCMNPIIFIDELDKVSKSEHGKEIIGILTHLVDSTQNESFQDKYFNGIDLDLSKALFIFSYNDPDAIDRILLDRIHRIKFDHLSLDDKLVIANNYLLPEIYKNVGLTNIIKLSDEILIYIIENYTYEAGVRKLKEILFEIISEINLSILQNTSAYTTIPIEVTKEDIKHYYLKERTEVRHAMIHDTPQIGVINGLWANALGKGGIIPIECYQFPAQNFMDLRLTGLQGEVMKESMNVAKTLAWKLTSNGKKKRFIKAGTETKMQGIHIHCPEGATPKDGPSAGTAITTSIYSLLNDKKIKNNIAITGEINLQGKVTAIGGLKLKILGGIKAGVTEFIFPKDNEKDFKKFMDKHGEKDIIKNIIFHPVINIREVLALVFV
jgi:ATP-dependent Lon protease